MQLDLEIMREVRDYETPKGLRHVSIFLICTLPIILLAPFWLSFCDKAVGGSVVISGMPVLSFLALLVQKYKY